MRSEDLIMLTLKHSTHKMIAGRTLFQKTLYCLNARLKLGLEFTAHYYGPYSSLAADTVARLESIGIVEERVEHLPPLSFGMTFEPRKYIYRLTDIGEKIADLAEEQSSQEAESIKNALQLMRELGTADDYRSLSVAAKMHHILEIENRGMKPSEILLEANALGWTIQESQARAAVDFLKKMGMVKEIADCPVV